MIRLRVPVVVGGVERLQDEIAYGVDDYTPMHELFDSSPRYKKDGIEYIHLAAAFDIETTNIDGEEPFAYMYHWQFCAGEIVTFGRTWQELRDFLAKLKRIFFLAPGKRHLVIYVHNLAFEHVFLERFFPMSKVFARAPRKPIREVMDGCFELRCSYFLSNMSLAKFCENSPGAIHRKLSGSQYNYKKLRTPSTPMTEEELAYCYNDVRGLCECIAARLEEHRITQLPLTSTGYVRRYARKAVLANPRNALLARKLALTPEQYTLCKDAFRGGNTHADASYIEDVIEVDCYDEASAYPACMLLDRYPMTPFLPAHPSRALEYMEDGLATLGHYRFEGIKQKRKYGIPYIPSSHCKRLREGVFDNGRVLSADSLEISLTDVDLKIILRTYDFESCSCSRLFQAEYGYLPAELREVVKHFFELKSRLKGDPDKIYEYNKAKNSLNSLFGMLTTDIAAPDIEYKDGKWGKKQYLRADDTPMTGEEMLAKRLHEHYKSYGLFGAYQWGIWVTANARARLQRLIDACVDDWGDCAVAYTDTDSGKIIGGYGPVVIERLNAQVMEEIAACPIPPIVEVDGKTYTMGLWEYEGRKRLKTYGSKKYLTAEADGSIEITVAGLSKSVGGDTLLKMAGVANLAEKPGRHKVQPDQLPAVFDAFGRGAVFNPSGRTTAYYNDAAPHFITINGEEIETAANIAVIDTTYTLGLTGELSDLVHLAHNKRANLAKKRIEKPLEICYSSYSKQRHEVNGGKLCSMRSIAPCTKIGKAKRFSSW